MAEFERIEKVSYLRIFTHNKNKRKFMISCCDTEDYMRTKCIAKILEFTEQSTIQFHRSKTLIFFCQLYRC